MTNEQLASVEKALVRIEVIVSNLDEKLRDLKTSVQVHHRCVRRALHGTDEHPGLNMRIDRLENWHKRVSKVLIVILVAAVPLVLSRFWELFV